MPVEVEGDFESLLAQVKEQAEAKLRETAEACIESAKAQCPYDDSKSADEAHLRDTIRLEGDEVIDAGDTLTAQVTAGDPAEGVDYGPFVELGTYKMGAQPFLGPAYEEARTELEGSLGQIIA